MGNKFNYKGIFPNNNDENEMSYAQVFDAVNTATFKLSLVWEERDSDVLQESLGITC